ncbi:C40 family peptidase [Paenibacillus glycinis]|uniref:NlpC/P60 family protein n=1 Tax=Paenibacillus glycinis TaxID=2697035 RepID=A0ABW9XQS2_9BACL|nr:C40 family peptidase [Paenibacillus glycinis]NBD24906.1 NlpC/P60 family protein [Paenibacillus glycinis]
MNVKQTAIKISVVVLWTATGLTALGSGHIAKVNALSSETAVKLIKYSDHYLGTPYKFGASTSTTHYFDCSSFTKHVFEKFGYRLPRSAAEQAKLGHAVSKSEFKKGDLVFFKVPSRGNFIGHVGIYVGKGKMLNTFGSGGVKLADMDKSYWTENFVTARRLD